MNRTFFQRFNRRLASADEPVPLPPPPDPGAEPEAPDADPDREGSEPQPEAEPTPVTPLSKPRRWKRASTPTLLQMEAVECGAAALGIIMGYHGKYVTLEELRLACGVSRNGSKAINVLKAAKQYGLVADGWKKDVHEVVALKPPFMVFWNFSHFMVVEGFGRNRVYLNDPARGPLQVSADEFDQSYTGVAFTFEPGPDFKPGGRPPRLFEAMRGRLAGSGAALLLVVLAGLALVVPGLVVPAFTQIFIDQYLVRNLVDWVVPLLWIMGLTAVVNAFITWVQQYYLMRVQMKLAISMSSQFFWHILRLPVEFFSQRFCGEIGSRVSLNDTVASMLSGQLVTTLVSLLLIVFYAALLLCYQWELTVIGVLIACVNILALKWISRLRVDGNRRLLQEQGKLTGTTMAGLQIIETIKATGMEDDFFVRFSGLQAKVVNATQQLGSMTQVLNNVPTLLSSLNSAAILCLGAWAVIRGDMSVGMLVAFQALMGAFIGPFSGLVNMGSTVQEAEGNLNRLDDVLRAQVDPICVTAGTGALGGAAPFNKTILDGRIELRDVTFGYSRLDKPLISDFNLMIAPGQRVAVVGATGSGKSTLVNLVCGLYQPWAGAILVDGIPRNQVPRPVLASSLARVSQDIFLFAGSILDNLAMWDKTLPMESMVRAAKDACIDDVIMSRPGGYFAEVGESGANFSGGQRQRLEIARALAVNPSIMVLDEATSSLDPITEQRIDANLRRRGCTCLIIAHRLSTIRDCDEIIVLSHGHVVERGTHEQLIGLNRLYAKLIQN